MWHLIRAYTVCLSFQQYFRPINWSKMDLLKCQDKYGNMLRCPNSKSKLGSVFLKKDIIIFVLTARRSDTGITRVAEGGGGWGGGWGGGGRGGTVGVVVGVSILKSVRLLLVSQTPKLLGWWKIIHTSAMVHLAHCHWRFHILTYLPCLAEKCLVCAFSSVSWTPPAVVRQPVSVFLVTYILYRFLGKENEIILTQTKFILVPGSWVMDLSALGFLTLKGPVTTTADENLKSLSGSYSSFYYHF